MIKVLYPGSFDPITLGHMNVIDQASDLFDEIIVGILYNSNKKNTFFTDDERIDIIKEIYANNSKIKVVSSNESTVDLALLYECKAIIRGLRSLTDFEYEIQLAQINKDISEDRINTICLFADPRLQNVSSSVVKEVFRLNKSISKYVCPEVEKAMVKKNNECKNIR